MKEAEKLGVVKYKWSALFWKLCAQSMSVCVLSRYLRFKLFPKSGPNPNERSESVLVLIHRVAEVPKKSGQLILNVVRKISGPVSYHS